MVGNLMCLNPLKFGSQISTREVIKDAKRRNALIEYIDLCHANLRYADLRSENLCRAKLAFSDLSFAYLHAANLSYAHLISARFHNADLYKADLRGANCSSADFSNSSLVYADLSNADISKANFSGADLSCADLSGVRLCNTIGNMKEIHSAQLKHFGIVWTDRILAIGCKQYTIEEWRSFTDQDIFNMTTSLNSVVLWQKWKTIIFAMIKLTTANRK